MEHPAGPGRVDGLDDVVGDVLRGQADARRLRRAGLGEDSAVARPIPAAAPVMKTDFSLFILS